jgi:hypothetical protein
MAKDLTKFLDEFHYHEAQDRASVICQNINDHLIQHPVCKLDKEVSKKVEDALSSLYDAYQTIGQRSEKLFNNDQTIQDL